MLPLNVKSEEIETKMLNGGMVFAEVPADEQVDFDLILPVYKNI